MSYTPLNFNSPEVVEAFRKRFKEGIKDGNLGSEIPNIIFEMLGVYGIEIPDHVKQAISDYHPNPNPKA